MNATNSENVVAKSHEEVVDDICKVLKDNGFTFQQSFDILKSAEKQIVLNMPLTASLDSRIK